MIEHLQNNADVTDTLVCHWKNEEQEHHCTTAKGSTNDIVINNVFRHEIPNVSRENAGTYTCFVVPEKGSKSQSCKMTVEDGPADVTEATTTANGTVSFSGDNSFHVTLFVCISIASVVILLVATVLVVMVFKRKRPNVKNSRRVLDTAVLDEFFPRQRLLDQADVHFLPQVVSEDHVPASLNPSSAEKIEELLEVFRLSRRDITRLMEIFGQEMVAGDTQRNKDIPYVYKASLTREPYGAFVIIDLSCSILKIHLVRLQDRSTGARSQHYTIPPEIKLGTGIQLFDAVAGCVQTFAKEHKLCGKKFSAVFVFSFPCATDRQLTTAVLSKWTKQFRCDGVKGNDVGKLLQTALEKRQICRHLKVTHVVRDDIATLIWVAHKDPLCKTALTVTDGFYACYEQGHQSTGWQDSSDGSHAHRTVKKADLGAVGAQESLDDFQTDFDKDLDKYSIDPGNRIMEKMVSIMYQGEVVRLILVTLAKQGLLFQSTLNQSSSIFTRGGLKSDHVSLLESDTSYYFTKHVLTELQVKHYTNEDCRIVQQVTRIVSERSAKMAATGLATLINFLDQPAVTVAIDGQLNNYHPYFQRVMETQTSKLVKPGLKFKIVSSHDGSEMGAALIAAAFLNTARRIVTNKDSDKQGQKETKKTQNTPPSRPLQPPLRRPSLITTSTTSINSDKGNS
ncbi:hypothetical protein V1264_016567 [Littorina saxatilis]